MERAWAEPAEMPRCIAVTGGAGFIGSAFLNLLVPAFPSIRWVNIDKLTYAGNPLNLEPIRSSENYDFEHVDLADLAATCEVITRHSPDWIFHFAAETHVDRSIKDPSTAIQSNLIGTFNLLEAAREVGIGLFHHISTDEVFGSLGADGMFDERTAYDPSSPYSASKAGADHLVRAWRRTYGLNTRITNCSNNYGPRQFPEKLIPLMILNAASQRELPVYGDGRNVRDWLHVEDHVEAIWLAACRGGAGETYAIGGGAEASNLQVVEWVCEAVSARLGSGPLNHLIKFVEDRPGHDFRYAIDASKIQKQLGWQPRFSMAEGLNATVDWYLDNPAWVESVRTGEYLGWIRKQYGDNG
jgi:dTDP-glucose 4,6-dehydratase